MREQVETQALLCKKNGKLYKEGNRKGVAEAAAHRCLFNPFLLQKMLGGGGCNFLNNSCRSLRREDGTALLPPYPLQTGFVLWVKLSEKVEQLLI